MKKLLDEIRECFKDFEKNAQIAITGNIKTRAREARVESNRLAKLLKKFRKESIEKIGRF